MLWLTYIASATLHFFSPCTVTYSSPTPRPPVAFGVHASIAPEYFVPLPLEITEIKSAIYDLSAHDQLVAINHSTFNLCDFQGGAQNIQELGQSPLTSLHAHQKQLEACMGVGCCT